MRVGMIINYAGGFSETVTELGDFEKAGLQILFVAEAYSFDAVSQLGFIAARTSTLEIASGILPIYSRTPALTAMTAAGLDFVSEGRFTLGLGSSGPQVIEGWHGVPFDAPIGRTRELIEICRMVWRRERLEYHGKHYNLPLDSSTGRGTGLGKPLKLINHPVRERIPIDRPEERGARRRAGRGLAAHLLRSREGRAELGRAARRGQGQAGRRPR
jgi:F420-dependent oxidoreductase-like protein